MAKHGQTIYYDNCYKGINCPALSGANPSDQQSEEPPPKVSRIAELDSLLKDKDGSSGLQETQGRLPGAKNNEQPTGRGDLLTCTIQTNQVEGHLHRGAASGSVNRITNCKSNQSGPADCSATIHQASLGPSNNMVQLFDVEKGAAALQWSLIQEDHRDCQGAISDGHPTYASEDACEQDGTKLTGDCKWNVGQSVSVRSGFKGCSVREWS